MSIIDDLIGHVAHHSPCPCGFHDRKRRKRNLEQTGDHDSWPPFSVAHRDGEVQGIAGAMRVNVRVRVRVCLCV